MNIQEFHINEIISGLKEVDARIANIMADLDSDEQLAMCALIVKGRFNINEFPTIPNSEIARDIVVTRFNQLKGKVYLKYTSLKEKKYVNNGWQVIDREEPTVKETYLRFEEYMSVANGIKPFNEY